MFIALYAYVLRHLIRPDAVAEQVPQVIRKSYVGVVFYLLGAAIAWLDVYLAFVAYALTPLFFIVPPTRARPAPHDALRG